MRRGSRAMARSHKLHFCCLSLTLFKLRRRPGTCQHFYRKRKEKISMALETVVFQQDPFSYGWKDVYSSGGGGGQWVHGFSLDEEEKARHVHEAVINTTTCTGSVFNPGNGTSSPSSMGPNVKELDTNSSSQEIFSGDGSFAGMLPPMRTPVVGRRKRRRSRSVKNLEEVEQQRMTHIAVERNRRKQMNDYLAVLRSMMPPSYVQRGDQASIIGGAINFVKELEQLLHSLESHKRLKKEPDTDSSPLFSDFFSFPQYSTLLSSTEQNKSPSSSSTESVAQKSSAIADVEVTMVESHANLKILSKRPPKQLVKMVAGLYSLCLSVLHLNVTTVDDMVLYSFSVKVEDECHLTSINEIAAAVYKLVGRIQEEATSNF